MQKFTGKVHNYYDNTRVFDMIVKNKIMYFYLAHSMAKKFEVYLSDGAFATFCTSDRPTLIGNVYAYPVISFERIFHMIGTKEVNYYDINQNKENVKKVLNKDAYRLFIDLEFTMPPYDYHHTTTSNKFKAEIIQYGMCLEDADGNLIDSSSGVIKPLDERGINERTLEFVHLSYNDVANGEYYSKFYNTLKDYMTLYQPIIYVWGRNDYLMIKESYTVHKVEPLTERKHYVNLMQLIKTYYNIKNDIGLYNAFELFNKETPLDKQDHNALHDASATMLLYHLFEEEINK